MTNIKKEAEKLVSKLQEYCESLEKRGLLSSKSTQEAFISYMGDKLLTDTELTKEICVQARELFLINNLNLCAFCSASVLNDRSTALEIVKTNGDNLEHLKDEFKDDKEFILEALKYANVLAYASDRLKDDNDVVRLALQENPKAIEYASDRFRKDKAFINNLIKSDHYLIGYLHKDLLDDAEFLANFWEIIKENFPDSNMLLQHHARGIIENMGDELKPWFSQLDMRRNASKENIIEDMEKCFEKYRLNKRLNASLPDAQNSQPKRPKL